jgi:hypothetical protein
MMQRLTDPRQFRLALGMMVTDPASGLTREERAAARYWAQADGIPGHWRWRAQRYLDERYAQREEATHGDD